MTIRKLLLTSLISVALSSCGGDDDDDNNDDTGPVSLVLTEGDYTGRWTSTAGTRSFNISISAEIEETSAGKFNGAFFISNNFTSCCNSGDDDGTITFDVSDDQVSNFIWKDVIPSCTGTFRGDGRITAENTFTLEFTGTDCDGDHVGSLTLSK